MKIAWNKVTWYSKLIALILFVALPFIGFWYGMQYGELIAPLSGGAQSGFATSTASGTSGSDYYSNVAEWQTNTRPDGGFSIAYPIDFTVEDNYSMALVPDWSADADGSQGQKMVIITIPAAFEPQTNFADATLTVGRSTDSDALAGCLMSTLNAASPLMGQAGDFPMQASSTIVINGITFTVFKSSSVGAGNLYDTTNYRTLHAGACYAVEYTIHSSQIANYPPSYNLQPFNEGEVTSVLDRMVGTFMFQ